MKNLEKSSQMEKKAIKDAEKIIAHANIKKSTEKIIAHADTKKNTPHLNTNKHIEKNMSSAKAEKNKEKVTPATQIVQKNKTINSDQQNKISDMKKIDQKNSQKETSKTQLSLPKNNTKKIIIISIITFFILVLLVLSVIFGIITSNSDKIISGISIDGIDVSNLTKSEALDKLNTQLSNKFDREITLKHGDYTTKLNINTLGANYELENSISSAYNMGRSESNIFANNFKIISTFLKKNNITSEISYKDNLLDEKIAIINNELPDRVVNSNYKIENNNLIIENSTDGYRINNTALKSSIYSAIINNESSIEIPVEEYHADKVDIEAIYKEVYKSPKDATYTTNPYEIHKEENGLDFAITLDKAKEMINQKQDTYTIPLKTLTPKVTVKTLPQEAFPDLLATYSTSFATSNYNRSTNISLATQAVNGYVLMPGETFSYNTTVGQRTAARGYKEAGVYVNGAVTTGIGGGICQVSSTLYNAVLRCNLEIVDRSNHTFEPSYVPAGLDATVSWQSPDFKFKNNRNYPIKLSATSAGKKIVFNVYGLKTSDDYEVKLVSSKIATIPFSTEYKDDSSLPAGTTKILQGGSNGCKTQTYKILYKNGTEVSRTLINSDTYRPHNQVVARGTKVVQTPSVEPTTPTEPSTSPDSSVTITDVPAE